MNNTKETHRKLLTAIEQFKLEIAQKDYSGSRFAFDSKCVADTFEHHCYSIWTGAIVDPFQHKVWIVYLDTNGIFVYRSVI